MTSRIVFIVLNLALAAFMYARERKAAKQDKTQNEEISELDAWMRQKSSKTVRVLLILAGLQILMLILDISEGR